MELKFWGVRGSIPTPLNSAQLRSRISAVVQRIQPEHLRTQETREAFLATLPEYLFGTVGGNTTCIEVIDVESRCFIVDCGTGLRELGYYYSSQRQEVKEFHIFLTHFHWDHIQGIPFFNPAFVKANKIIFYSPVEDFETIIKNQMKPPYFPIEMNLMAADIQFKILKEPLKLGKIKISWKQMKHPGISFSYKFVKGGKSIIIATDSEITEKEFKKSQENIDFFSNTNILVLDSQYTLEESFAKIDWGHSSYSMGVDLASAWKVRKLVLFHHEPMYNDRKIMGIERRSKWYLAHQDHKEVKIFVAVEGLKVEAE